MILLGLGAAILLTPACKAQEVSPDHFTDTGVQNVYEGAPAKVATPIVKQNLSATQARKHQVNSPTTMHTFARCSSVWSAQLDTPTVADNRKPALGSAYKPIIRPLDKFSGARKSGRPRKRRV